MIKCLIVDDEQMARELLKSYVAKLPQLELVAMCKNAVEAMDQMHEHDIDLLLLDIQMPDLSGVNLLKSISKKPVVVFTTAYSEYALEGYELEVTDYLLKPIGFDRFVQAINKAVTAVKAKRITQDSRAMTEAYAHVEEHIIIKADHRTHKVPFTDIRYIEGQREYVTFNLTDKRITALESLKMLEATLPESRFIRVHKSFIVNKSHVKSLYGNQLELEGKSIPVGKSYRSSVLRIFEV